MTRPVAACPNCSAPVEFRWSSAVQTVCGHCRSVVVRHDVDLEGGRRRRGPAADRLAHSDRHARAVSGRPLHRHRPHRLRVRARHVERVARRVRRRHAAAGCRTRRRSTPSRGSSRSRHRCRPQADLEVGQTYAFGDFSFQLTTLTRARYRGVEGELPFEYWDKDEVAVRRPAVGRRPLRDASTTARRRRCCFLGAFVEFDELELKDLRAGRGRAAGEDRRVQLPQLRRGHRAAGRRAHQVGRLHQLRRDSGSERPECPDPAGGAGARTSRAEDPAGHARHAARPRLRGHRLPVPLHRRRRRDSTAGTSTCCSTGSRASAISASTRATGTTSRRCGRCRDQTSAADARRRATRAGRSSCSRPRRRRPTSSLGQFPWRVRAFDVAGVSDYIAPPLLLSAERTDEETTWSLGEYTPGARHLEGVRAARAARRAPVGVFANQPSPHKGKVGVVLGDLCGAGAAGGGCRPACARRRRRASRCSPAATSSRRPPSTRRS